MLMLVEGLQTCNKGMSQNFAQMKLSIYNKYKQLNSQVFVTIRDFVTC